MTDMIPFSDRHPAIASRGVDEAVYNSLAKSIYPGANEDSIAMVLDYCKSRQLDPLQKPVHIIPMSVKVNGSYQMRDVIMPGINTYRIQASRTKALAGISAPTFGDMITEQIGSVKFTYPEWCEVTVYKLLGGEKVPFVAREYFLEAYATKSRNDSTPNAMWAKRPKGQLSKCAESMALRKGFPEIGQQPTFEEMEGKTVIKEVTPVRNDVDLLEMAAGGESLEDKVYSQHLAKMEATGNFTELKYAFGVGYSELRDMDCPELMDTLKIKYNELKEKYDGEVIS